MELAGPPCALLLGGGERLSAALALDRLGGGDGGCRARRKRLEQPLVVAGESRPVHQTVDGDQHPMSSASEHQRDDQSTVGADTEPAEPVALEPRPVGSVLQPQGPERPKRPTGEAVFQVDALAE